MSKLSERYRKDEREESFLEQFNNALTKLEEKYLENQKEVNQPVIFICGAPRSGTTLIGQVLAKTKIFNYVTNFTARFWRTPYIGFYLEKILRLREFDSGHSWESDFGRTSGVLGPHEFSYFWEYWLKPNPENDMLPESKLYEIDVDGLRKEINAIINVYGKPVFFKNKLFFINLSFLSRIFKNAFFVVTTRDPLSNALSLYEARKQYFGSEDGWFSAKPANYGDLKKLPVEKQIAGQIFTIYSEIKKQEESIKDRIIYIKYETLCSKPAHTVKHILDSIQLVDVDLSELRLRLPEKFTIEDITERYPSELIKRFESALKEF